MIQGARAAAFLVAAAVGLAGRAAEPADTAPLTAERMWEMKRLGNPALSPDGRVSVVPVTAYDVKQDKGLTDLWLVPSDGGAARPLTTHESNESGPAWSPDGQWIAFEARRGDDEAAQIYVIPAAGGEARRVTQVPTGASAPRWFPDSKRIAFLSRVWPDLKSWDEMGRRIKERKDSKVSARTFDRAPIRYWDTWLDDRETHVYTVAVGGGAPAPVTLGTGRQLTRAEPGTGSYDISPDGAEIAFAADLDPTGVDSNFDVFVVPAGGGTARNVSSENPASDGSPQYSPDGRWLAFGRQTIKGFYGDTVRLVLHDRKTGKNQVVAEQWDRSAAGLVWRPDGRGLYGVIDDAGTSRVYALDVAGGAPKALTKERSYSGLDVSRDGRTLVGLRQGFTEPPTLVRLDPATGAATVLSHFNDDLLAGVAWGTYESVTYPGANGDPIQMWVNYPPGFDRSKKWPLFLLIHGGPHNGATDATQWRWNAQVFSAWGYVTAWPNFHGSSGFGQKFTDSINPDWATQPYEDVLKAADWFRAQPWIDAERLTAGGGSYGGYLTTLILGRPHPFKALVAHAAVYDLFMQYAADFGASRRRHGEYWATPEALKVLEKTSPHLAAASFKTPTLVIVGEKDYRVPATHGLELFHTLQNKGVKSRLLYYPDENHWILKPQNSQHWYTQVRSWLKDFVREGPL
jgi:dipeptidyl aminopeptidase/acylaminoacyl peptidase